jgi:hypothetical protein
MLARDTSRKLKQQKKGLHGSTNLLKFIFYSVAGVLAMLALVMILKKVII